MITSLATVIALGLALPSSAPAELPSPDAHERAMMAAVVDDKAPEVLLNIRKENYNEHYLAGNEEHMELFYAPLKDLGGVYAGVGTDQAYFFMGWMKAKFAFLTDYDPWVKHIHQVYAVLFKHAKTPDEFRVMWSKRKRKLTLKLLKEAGLSKGTINIYKWGRYLVARRLILQRKYFLKKHPNVPTFLTDQAQYDYVRNMVVQGRVRPMIGNLLDNRGMASVARFCQLVGQPLRAFYISNAEQYWPRYSANFRTNIKAQWVDDKSLFVRTLASQPQNGGFRYVVQPFKNFQQFMDLKWARRVNVVVPRAKLKMGEFRLERLVIDPTVRKQQWAKQLATMKRRKTKRLPAK